MIEQAYTNYGEQRRNHEVALMQIHRNPGYSIQCNGAPGVCVTLNSERDFFLGGIHELDGIPNPPTYVAFNEGLMTARWLPEVNVYYQDFSSFQTHPGHVMKQGPVLQRNWDSPVQPESRMQNIAFKMHPQGNAQGMQVQEFQYFVVIDFEATCDMGTRLSPQEIIEFPSVLVNGVTGRLEGHFQTYIKPVYHPVLTDFCKDLTGIQQNQVVGGVSLSEALLMHDNWLEERGVKNTTFAIVTWSDWDCKVMLESECNLKGIRKPSYFNRWINLKIPFYDAFHQLNCNLKGAVQLAGLTWEGRAHCGLDDARNTARLLVDLMRRGIKLSITNSMSPSDASRLPHPNQIRTKNVTSGSCGSHSFVQGLGSGILLNAVDEDCYCGVRCNKCMIKKPGPQQGKVFFGCGNWSVTRGSMCGYFKWAVPDLPLNA
uniref:TSA: Wollemia nobilis Ref_Wollemi_Transcript_7026_1851 transcribed RNA sequence n=1 Tax=Wollemia nobilis TaxID=56998 RepID=A0A0C9RX82_9CONI